MIRFALPALVVSAFALVACSSEGTVDTSKSGQTENAPGDKTAPAVAEAPKEIAPEVAATEAAAAPSDVAATEDDSMEVDARSWGVGAALTVNGFTTALNASRSVEISTDGTRMVQGSLNVRGPLGSTVTIEHEGQQVIRGFPGIIPITLGAAGRWNVTVTGPFGRSRSFAYGFEVGTEPGEH